MSTIRLVVGGLLVILVGAGCGGGDSADAGPLGACSGTYSQAFPSEDDAQFCMFPWDVSKPALELTECDEVLENCSTNGTTPNFGCLTTPVDHPATPATVTMTGFVDVFSSGPNADGARIQVFRHNQLDGVTDIDTVTPIASFDVELDDTTLAGARACPAERDLESEKFGQGRCALPDDNCPACDKLLNAVDFCNDTTCDDLQRWEVGYAIPNMPTNELLVVRSVGLDGSGNPETLNNTWAPLIQYNVFMGTGDTACSTTADCELGGLDAVCSDCIDTTVAPPIYRSDANLLSSQDYMTIPTSAGLSGGIAAGHGAIAGEVHDCDSVRVRHAQVGFSVDNLPKVLVFFNGNPVKTLPRLQQINDGSNLLGLYSGLDVDPGPLDVVSVGILAGELIELNRFTAQVWPDSVSLVRLGGGRPAQP